MKGKVIKIEKILDVSQCICNEYQRVTGQLITEEYLHILLYYSQKEKLRLSGIPLFEEPMLGWICYPVSLLVRSCFFRGEILHHTETIHIDNYKIVKSVVEQYAIYASWKLIAWVKEELPWKNSRKNRNNRNDFQALQLRDFQEEIFQEK